MNKTEKIYRIFVSSCLRLLQDERQILSTIILQHGHLPLQMEYNFDGSTEVRSIEVDTQKIRQSDSVICILSYLYGEVIGKKIGDIHQCPLFSSRCANCSCRDLLQECSLSFTEFEYEYAKSCGKKIFVISNRKYNDQSSFEQALGDAKIQDQEKENYIDVFKQYRRDNNRFIEGATSYHAFPYTSREEFKESGNKAVIAALHSIEDTEKEGINEFGLVPASYLNKLRQNVEHLENKLNELTANGIETIYDSQTSAILSLAESAQQENIYLDASGNLQKIRVLAIRGISFVQSGMGHEEWSRFIISSVFKRKQIIPVEFVLADYQNQKLIEYRYKAFSRQVETIEEFYDSYQEEMKTVQRSIQQYKKNNPCSLYYHQEARLPFRMIFIGKFLFLSTFISDVPASRAPVMKIPYTSSLYKVCEEYYDWIKNRKDTMEYTNPAL